MIGLIKRPAFVLIGLVGFIVIAMSAVSLVSAIMLLNKPFAGFIVYDPPFIASMGLKDWPGQQKGLKFLDRIVSVDGQAVYNGKDVVENIKDKKPGAPVRYVVESKGEMREITVPVTIFGLRDFTLTFFINFLCGFILCILGIIVVSLKPNMVSSWIFLALGVSLGGYLMTGFEIMTSYILVHFHYVLACIYPVAILHLALIFPDKKRIVIRFPAIEYLIYLPILFLIVGWQIYLINYPKLIESNAAISSILSYKFLGSMTRLFLLFSVVLFVILVLHSMFKSSTISSRQRARMILFGVSIGFLPPVVIMMVSHVLKVSPNWNFLPFFVIFFPASIAYSIVKHNLFDADVIIRRTAGYVVVTAVVVAAYAGVSLVLNALIGKSQIAQSTAFPILFTLGVILIFNPLRDRVQAIVDRIFFRKEYDYGAIVEKVSGAMTSLLELPLILKQLVQTFMEDMFLSTSSVMLLTADGNQYQIYIADGEKKEEVENKTFKRENPLIGIIEEEKRELTKYDVIEDPKYRTVCESSVSNFEALQASLVVPLVYQDQVIGSLNLGDKKSGKPFNREDIDLLRTLAHQGAVAIENARLFQENLEKQRMEEELNIARDLQVSMLPTECPTVKGFNIAAYSVSAREVGGDFYDFIDMGENKAGFVIGDVTGKSVSGALVMSASRSVFRMLSEEDLEVSDSMIRANRRLKKDVKSGMFVALLFAVLNSEDQTVTLCSAGQTQPIHFSVKSGEAKLVETAGDTFPLGILEDASYEETRLQLNSGDKVIFYTDGIVEAMNEQKEIFGFEKLQKLIKSSQTNTVEALMNEITTSVQNFAGGAPQHDDITVIVVSVD